jgi:hypothetical protein
MIKIVKSQIKDKKRPEKYKRDVKNKILEPINTISQVQYTQ